MLAAYPLNQPPVFATKKEYPMKSILSASICAAALALALPAMAATDDATPMHHHHHKMGMHGKHAGMHGKGGMRGDASTDALNEKSLAAARGGTDASMAPGAAPAAGAMAAPGAMSAPGAMAAPGAMSAPASGTSAETMPSNAPAGAMAAPAATPAGN